MVGRPSLASLDSGAESTVYFAASTRLPARHAGNRLLGTSGPGQAGLGATRGKPRYVGRRPAGRKMVCKGHPCIYAADGYPMTSFASSWDVPRGPRSPGKHSGVHGREG